MKNKTYKIKQLKWKKVPINDNMKILQAEQYIIRIGSKSCMLSRKCYKKSFENMPFDFVSAAKIFAQQHYEKRMKKNLVRANTLESASV